MVSWQEWKRYKNWFLKHEQTTMEKEGRKQSLQSHSNYLKIFHPRDSQIVTWRRTSVLSRNGMPFNGFFFVKDSPAVLLVYCSAYRSSWGIYELDEFRSLVCILNASTDESHVSMCRNAFCHESICKHNGDCKRLSEEINELLILHIFIQLNFVYSRRYTILHYIY